MKCEWREGIEWQTLNLLRAIATLLQEDACGEARLRLPKVGGRDAALEVELQVRLERVVRLHLHLSQSLCRHHSFVLERGVIGVAPGRPKRKRKS